MLKLFSKKVAFFTIIFLILLLLIVTQSNIYNQLHTIDDKELVVMKATESIPVKISLENSKWGGVEVEDELHLQNIVSLFDQITENGKIDDTMSSKHILFRGKIVYSNGTQKHFTIGEALTVDNHAYINKKVAPVISALKSSLLELYYTPEKIGSVVEQSAYTIMILNGEKIKV